eukprot:5899640-Prymnesium_polylepis.1
MSVAKGRVHRGKNWQRSSWPDQHHRAEPQLTRRTHIRAAVLLGLLIEASTHRRPSACTLVRARLQSVWAAHCPQGFRQHARIRESARILV